ncbi:hypothetical protein AB836_01305 [Rickettsiales bacterium (ex Bugula neritina AB1)]|nr:hypothetical protein AB836_01305 [Rickettsiales bacterium (ex Bugula neritina AB1)]
MKIYFNTIRFLFIFICCFTQKSIKEYLNHKHKETIIPIVPFYLIYCDSDNHNNHDNYNLFTGNFKKNYDNDRFYAVIMGCKLPISFFVDLFNNIPNTLKLTTENYPDTIIFIEYHDNEDYKTTKCDCFFKLKFYDSNLKIYCNYYIYPTHSNIKGEVEFLDILSILERFCGCFFPNKNKKVNFNTNVSLFMHLTSNGIKEKNTRYNNNTSIKKYLNNEYINNKTIYNKKTTKDNMQLELKDM